MCTIVKAIASIIAIWTIGAAFVDAGFRPTNVCDPCGGADLSFVSRNRLIRHVSRSTQFALSISTNAFTNFKMDSNVNGRSDLKEWCGTAYNNDVVAKNMNLKSVRQLIVEVMVNLKDATQLLPRARNSANEEILTKLNYVQGHFSASLCAIDALDSSSSSLPSDKCVISSQIDRCLGNMYYVKDMTRDKRMVSRFFTNAIEILQHLKRRIPLLS